MISCIHKGSLENELCIIASFNTINIRNEYKIEQQTVTGGEENDEN